MVIISTNSRFPTDKLAILIAVGLCLLVLGWASCGRIMFRRRICGAVASSGGTPGDSNDGRPVPPPLLFRRRKRPFHRETPSPPRSKSWKFDLPPIRSHCPRAGYRGYTAQIGSPITLGPPTDMVRKFWEEITLPGYDKIVAEMLPGKNAKAMQDASKFFRDKGVQSRPTQCHGIDIVTDNPHITSDHIGGIESDMILKPGMIIMAEPNPITADGMFGIFLGHTYIITDTGREIVDEFPFEIAVAG